MPFYNSVRTEDRTLPLTVHAILRMSIPRQRPVVTEMCLTNSVSEPLPSNGPFWLSDILTLVMGTCLAVRCLAMCKRVLIQGEVVSDTRF